jgi:SAM-dependent methyltransferase
VSKDPASKDPDDLLDPAPLRRRRKGGLRIPEDNVPRPNVAGPAPEDPRNAAEVAFAFGADERGGDERATEGDQTIDESSASPYAVRPAVPAAIDTTEPSSPRLDAGTTDEHPRVDPESADEARADSVDIPIDEDDDRAPAAAAPAARRAHTVALADSDIEEVDDDGDPTFEVARANARARMSRAIAPADDDVDRTIPVDLTSPEEMEAIEAGAAPASPAPAATTGQLADDELEEVEVRAPVEPERPRRASTEPPPAPTRPTPSGGTPPVPNGGAAAAKSKPPPAPANARAAAVAAAVDVRETGKKPRRRGKPWFEEIFDEDYLRTLPFLTPQATQLEANFVMEALAIEPGCQVLDIGCGYGRHAMELAARGYHVVGLDSSLPLLLRGADEAQRRTLSINFVHGDMREISFDAQFDGAYCLFSTFGYFDDDTNKKTAQNICRALKPGARCVIEVLNRDYVIADLPSRVWWEGDGCVVLEEVDFNYFSSRVVSNRSVVFDDGRQLEQEISLRSFSLHELGKLLHTAGFRVLEVSGSMLTRGRFFGAHSRDIVVVVERRVDPR